MKLLIMADDFTGALDTGVKFAAVGVQTKVLVGTEIDFSVIQEDVLVVDTETRHMSADEAYGVVAGISAQAERAKVSYIYKKTDSALRGNVGAELTALLETSGQKRLPFQPAFPEMNRMTENGKHYIDGILVEDSPFGKDPFEPVRCSTVTELIGIQSKVKAYSLPEVTEDTEISDLEGILVFDAKSDEELLSTAKHLYDGGELHIMAGCAGFASVLPELLGLITEKAKPVPELDARLLVVCGSVNPITVSQLEEAEKAGFAHVHLSPQQKLEQNYWKTEAGQQTFEAIAETLKENTLCIIDSNDKEGNHLTQNYASERGLNIDDIRRGVAKSIGYLVDELFTSPDLGTLMITGGDTLLQCMESVGVRELKPICELEKGVVLSNFSYKGYSRYVISKSGGFGQKNLLVELAKKLTNKEN